MPGQQRKMVRLLRLAGSLSASNSAMLLAYSLRESGSELLGKRLFMQKIDRPGVDFHQHVLSDQLIEIMAGGISLHRETPGQPAGGEPRSGYPDRKIGLILQKSQQFQSTHRIPLFAISEGI